MTAFYNDIEKFNVKWLKSLSERGLIAQGEVNGESISDLVPTRLMDFDQVHFFAGIGGWSYALRLAGWPDDKPVWTGSCPCQPFSAAGKRGGFADDRHLWPDFFWHIKQCKPAIVFGEQVAGKSGLEWWDVVATDLERIGYACGQTLLTAAGVGFPHLRKRIYWVAVHANHDGKRLPRWSQNSQHGKKETWEIQFPRLLQSQMELQASADFNDDGLHGVSSRVGYNRGFGNAIVPQVAARFIRCVMEALLPIQEVR